MSILVLCPTRGRPEAMKEAASTLVRTRFHGSTQIMAVIDGDDPMAEEYIAGAPAIYDYYFPVHEGGMVAALNAAAMHVVHDMPDVTIIGFIGDDHRFRTLHWDKTIEQTLARPGYAYGYDGAWQRGEIPTQIFISREIVKALGYYALPDCHHLFVDNAWKAIAERVGRLHYLPEVFIEHMHPILGKAEWDEGHLRVNSDEMYAHDGGAFQQWKTSSRFIEDVRRVRRAIGSSTISTR